jgi:cytoskeletal protein RodZ
MLEAGDLGAFPGGKVQARGFLRIYARYLGLPMDEALARYEAQAQGTPFVAPKQTPLKSEPNAPSAPPAPVSTPPPSIPSRSRAPRRVGGGGVGVVLIGVLLLALLLGVGGGVWYFFLREAPEQPEVSEALTPVPVETLYPSLATPAPAVTPTPNTAFPVDPQGDVTVGVEASEHVWVRVTRDGQVAYSGLMEPGQVESWSTTGRIVLETGNAAGLLLTLNGQQQGPLGTRGETIARAWTPSGEVAVP